PHLDRAADRIDYIVDVYERESQLAVAEDEPTRAGVARDRTVDQWDAAAEDLTGAQDDARQALLRGGDAQCLRLELGPRICAALVGSRLELRALAHRAIAGGACPVDDR